VSAAVILVFALCVFKVFLHFFVQESVRSGSLIQFTHQSILSAFEYMLNLSNVHESQKHTLGV